MAAWTHPPALDLASSCRSRGRSAAFAFPGVGRVQGLDAQGLDEDDGVIKASSSTGTPWSWPSLPKARPRVRNLKMPQRRMP
eukprot:14729410-Heterocapsa_arctica.AAC.1